MLFTIYTGDDRIPRLVLEGDRADSNCGGCVGDTPLRAVWCVTSYTIYVLYDMMFIWRNPDSRVG